MSNDSIPRAPNCGRFLAETNDGRLLYLNHANEWQEMPNILAKPASEPAGGQRIKLKQCDDCSTDCQPCPRCLAALSSSAGPAVEAVAWRAVAHPETGMGAMIHPIKRFLVQDADGIYGEGQWDLQALVVAADAPDDTYNVSEAHMLGPVEASFAHPAPATVEMLCSILMDEIGITETSAGPRISGDDFARAAKRIAALAPATEARTDAGPRS